MRARALAPAFVLLVGVFASLAPAALAQEDAPRQRGPRQRGLNQHIDPDAPLGRAPLARPGRQDLLDQALADAPADLLRAFQRGRVRPAYEALSPQDQARFDRLLAAAGGPEARAVLLKALAAGHDLPALEGLARRIAGQDGRWLRERTTLTGPRGVIQQFGHTCGMTTVAAVRSEYDPVYALRVRDTNVDVHAVDDDRPYRLNQVLAFEQQAGHEVPNPTDGYAGVAVPRSDLDGRGRWVGDHLNALTPLTGLRYETTRDPEPGAVVDLLRDRLGQGMATPLVVGGAAHDYAHYVLATDARPRADGSSEFLVHDPGTGTTAWISEAALRSGDGLGPPLEGFTRVTAMEVPHPAGPAPG